MQNMNALNREEYISVDVEASGPYPPAYSMVSLGACLMDHPERTFYREIKPLNLNFKPEAMKVNKLDFYHLRQAGSHPKRVMIDFARWIAETCPDSYPTFVGFGTAFDWQFVNYYFQEFIGANPFRSGAMDIKAYAMGKYHLSWYNSRKKALAEIVKTDQPHTHNALQDAIEQADLFREIRADKLPLMVKMLG